MKYGDTLRQRSIPEWGHFNIDYDYLKDLIKHQTTTGTNKAVSIPGQGATSERAFGDTFYRALKSQHDRISLFIRSKSGEIERRLEHIGRSLEQLRSRQAPGASGQLPARVVERYAKIDADVAKAGEEVRSLSRFQVAQRTGFRKILKKYRRWTKDTKLERRYRDEMTKSESSFYQLDLGSLLDQYIDVLGALRAVFDTTGVNRPTSGSAKDSSPSLRISQATQGGNEVDLDLALSLTPLGSRGSKATYWIHSDHLVEAEVLILQHVRLWTGPNASTSIESPEATPKRRKSSTVETSCGSGDAVGLLVLDHPESFAIKQNASTMGANEETAGNLQAKAAANARWSSSGDAAVAIGLESQATQMINTAMLKRKHLAAFLNTSVPFHKRQNSSLQEGEGEIEENSDNTSAVRKWLTEHREVEPIAGICSKRTRFMGLNNSNAGGLWATLDRDVFANEKLHENLNVEDWYSDARSSSVGFPHSILEVRREGNYSPSLIQVLDHSHLVERVRGFSLEAHAVWACCKPKGMSAPFWISLLDQDIRKLPPPVRRQRRKVDSTVGSQSQTSPPQSSTPVTSLTDGQSSPYTSRNEESSVTSDFVEPPPLQAFRKKGKPYYDYPPPIQAEPEQQRYWNEYDNPESEDDGYYIYFDPNASVKLPGQEMLEAWAAKTKRFFGIREAPEEEPLLSSAQSSDDESGDDSHVAASKTYGTFASTNSTSQQHEGYFSSLFRRLRDPHREAQIRRETQRERRTLLCELQLRQHKTEMTKLRFYSTCLTMAMVIDILLSVMAMTSRRKQRGVVDFVVLFGTVCNAFLCGIAGISMKTRNERLGWVHQGIVAVFVGANIVLDVLLLRWAFGGL